MNKYEMLIEVAHEEYGYTFEVTTDEIETFVHNGLVPEDAIDAIINCDQDAEDYITEIIAVITMYGDYMEGYNLDQNEN
jgi:hypothetical protein